ncbi:MAG: sn-glycerol-3-phosphate ABC transporter ATP-binding protein UgpC [Betaproteobacteria bacterium]|nr:sn-glycerol-3-phosphate ABC transporter ATP-binding protein UgpC [Betaproteobacteria bacterium]
MAALNDNKAQKYFGQTHIIKGVSIDINDGEFCVLIGPSGCGKSTLLRMIAGLEEISGGEIKIGATVVNNMPPKERDIAMVFQNYALYPHMTVRDNMGFSLMLAKKDRATIEDRVGKAADILGLKSLLDRYPRQLSGGQRQRVAMGRAIVRDPQVFLFDEPLSNLDAKLRVAMRTEIKELHQRLKTTSIYVTHDQIEAMTMADKIVVMRDGIVEQTGSPLELYDHPVNQFVAGFIGSPAMNFLPGIVKGGHVELEGGAKLPIPTNARASDGQKVVYGTRPEHIELATGNEGIATEVVVVEPTGADTQVFTKIAGVEVTSVFRERHDFKPGASIRLKPDPVRAHLFDATTSLRLAA